MRIVSLPSAWRQMEWLSLHARGINTCECGYKNWQQKVRFSIPSWTSINLITRRINIYFSIPQLYLCVENKSAERKIVHHRSNCAFKLMVIAIQSIIERVFWAEIIIVLLNVGMHSSCMKRAWNSKPSVTYRLTFSRIINLSTFLHWTSA